VVAKVGLEKQIRSQVLSKYFILRQWRPAAELNRDARSLSLYFRMLTLA
jgi:hypothetical protein